MKRQTQAQTNPFEYSDTNKRYHTYDYDLRRRFGGKCVKIPLDAGLTCPNIDGTRGVGGCIYCSSRGSGDFAPDAATPLRRQYDEGRARAARKWDTSRCIPYLQAHTNTYAPLERVRAIAEEILTFPDAVAFHIATRADCLPEDILEYLATVGERIPLTIELGLQTIHDETARLINRCHTYDDFLRTYRRIRAYPHIRVGVHLIDGLPAEDEDEMLATAKTVGALLPDEIKFHLLYVLRDTPLAALYERGAYKPLEKDEYVDLISKQITLIPPPVVIGRLTGDAPADELLAPLWSKKKFDVLDAIDRTLYERNWTQGSALNTEIVV